MTVDLNWPQLYAWFSVDLFQFPHTHTHTRPAFRNSSRVSIIILKSTSEWRVLAADWRAVARVCAHSNAASYVNINQCVCVAKCLICSLEPSV